MEHEHEHEHEYQYTWEIDWTKIKTIEDIKYILMSFDLRPIVDHPDFDGLKKYCKLVDEDGHKMEYIED